MVQVGNVLLDPYRHPKNISMDAAPSSQQKGQGSSLSKKALLGAFPEVWEQQRGREAVGAGRERGPMSPSPWGITAKNPSEEE